MIASTGVAPADNVAGAFPDRAAWNRVVVETGATFLHTWEWGSARCQSAERTLWFHADDAHVRSAMVLTIKQIAPGLKLLRSPDGLFFSGDEAVFLQRLQQFLREHHVWGLLTKFRTATAWDNSSPAVKRVSMRLWLPRPTETLVLDISPDEEVLFANMRRSLREQIRAVQRWDVAVQEQSKSLVGDFWDMYHATAKARGFHEYKNENFLKQLVAAFSGSAGSKTPVHLFWLTAQRNGNHLAHYIGGVAGSQALQIWSAATPEGLHIGAKKLLQWEAIRMAKKLGAQVYDFGGIDRENLRGGYEFKRGYRGTSVRSSPYLLFTPGRAHRGLRSVLAAAPPLADAEAPGVPAKVEAPAAKTATPLVRVEEICSPEQWAAYERTLKQESLHSSWSWGDYKESQGWSARRLMIVEGNHTEPCGIAQVQMRRVRPFGPELALIQGGPVMRHLGFSRAARVVEALLDSLNLGPFSVVAIQPDADSSQELTLALIEAGFTEYAAAHSYTFTVPLATPKDELRRQLTSNWRHNLVRAEDKGCTVGLVGSESGARRAAFEKMSGMYDRLTQRKQFRKAIDVEAFCDSFLQDPRIDIVQVDWQQQPVAFRVLFCGSTRVMDVIAASNEESKNIYANYLAMWSAILRAQDTGAQEFDCGGIDPARNRGVYLFKRGIGADLVQGARTWMRIRPRRLQRFALASLSVFDSLV